MTTYTQIIYQVVFATKSRKPVLTKDRRNELYAVFYSILSKKNCHVFRIGGIEDHVHILFSLHQSIRLDDLIKDLKLGTSDFIKCKKVFTGFEGWQRGYGAFTYSKSQKDTLINYIINQEIHHRTKSSKKEMEDYLAELDIPYDPKYLE